MSALLPKADITEDCHRVRYGSLADIAAALPNVRFTPESGHQRRPLPCPLCAIRRQSAPQHEYRYSITSSARSRVAGEMVIPSSAAVLRFNTNSYFVGRSIGVPAGLDPCRILAAMTPALRK